MTKKAQFAIIGILLIANIATVLMWKWPREHQETQIHADRVEGLHVQTSDGSLDVRLGDTATGTTAVLTLTPHGTLQLHDQLGKMIALIEKSAAEASKGKRAGGTAPGQPL